MTARRFALSLLACVALAGGMRAFAQTAPAAGTANEAAAAAVLDRQLLLMLRTPPPHFRPEASYGGGYRDAPGRDARRRLARALARSHGLRLLDDWPMPALGLDCFVMEAPRADLRAQLLVQLASDPRVESVEPMQAFHVLSDHLPGSGDPLAATQPAVAQWHLRELHRLATGRRVTVAALDTGVDAGHPDLRGQQLLTRNFIDGQPYAAETHGTAVAGIIAARVDDGVGIAGIAPDVRLLGLRACRQLRQGGAACSSFSLAKALQFALEAKAQVLNLSLTGPPDRLLARLLDVALARGVSVVGAVDVQSADGGFPASHPGVLAVAGSQSPGSPPSSLLASGVLPSGVLPSGVLRAPDRGIPASRAGGGWDLVSGTSFAAAQVSGLVALLRELSPRLGATALRAALSAPATSTPLASTPIGLGLAPKRPPSIDACAAVGRVAGRCACDCAVAQAGLMPRQ
jgi:subtilisin family serine protease